MKNIYIVFFEQTWKENTYLENLREQVSVLILAITIIVTRIVGHQKFTSKTNNNR